MHIFRTWKSKLPSFKLKRIPVTLPTGCHSFLFTSPRKGPISPCQSTNLVFKGAHGSQFPRPHDAQHQPSSRSVEAFYKPQSEEHRGPATVNGRSQIARDRDSNWQVRINAQACLGCSLGAPRVQGAPDWPDRFLTFEIYFSGNKIKTLIGP